MNTILTEQYFYDAEKAREYLEQKRWPNGVACPHCGSLAYRLEARPDSKSPVRNLGK